MSFFLTKYIFPLEEATKPFWNNIYFDNPRTESETNAIADFLKSHAEKDEHFTENELELLLTEMLTTFSLNVPFSPNLNTIYHKLASIWIIVRFDYDFYFDDKNFDLLTPSPEKVNSILDFICFTCFQNSTRPCDTFLLNHQSHSPRLDSIKTNAFLIFSNLDAIVHDRYDSNEDDAYYLPFNTLYERIHPQIEKILKYEKDFRFNYISEQINHLNTLTYYPEKIMNLVSLFELLLAHKPDNNRFNVEESIKKMFSRKILLMLYLNDNTLEKDQIQKELNLIYDLRSDISHGNFENVAKLLKKFESLYQELGLLYDYYKNDDGDYRPNCIYEIIIEHLKLYLKTILNNFIDDETLLEILKEL